MRRALVTELPKKGFSIELDEVESKHLSAVLRLNEDDEVELLNGTGGAVRASIRYRGKKVWVEGLSDLIQNPRLNSRPIHLNLSILKGDAMEWVIEKAVEMGVKSMTPIETDYTVVQIKKKGVEGFLERWQKIADQSLKQCGRLERLIIQTPSTLEDVFAKKQMNFWLDEQGAQQTEVPYLNTAILNFYKSSHSIVNPAPILALLVGPEGGFSPAERERLTQLAGSEIIRTHLGEIILRAETAALMGISLLAGNHDQFQYEHK